MNSFILVRHSYDDHSYIDGKNDTDLTEKGITIAKDAIKVIEPKVETNEVVIRHSSKKRASQTAEIFCDYLLMKGYNCRCVNDGGLTELFQGNFDFKDMTHQEKIDFLQNCWDYFEYWRLNGVYDYRFGQEKSDDIKLKPGENHLEWSNRIANGLLNIISDLENGYQSIDICHRGAIYEIEQLVKFSNGLINMEDVEKYQTRWMSYCQDYKLNFDNIDQSKILIKKYINSRRP